MCWEKRKEYLNKNVYGRNGQEHLVWCVGQNGKIFGATVDFQRLGRNKIEGGPHDGLLWWPQGDFSC